MSCVPVREVDDRLLGQDLARSAEQEMGVRELVADCSGEGAIVRLQFKKSIPEDHETRLPRITMHTTEDLKSQS